jgi:hypothetical protein
VTLAAWQHGSVAVAAWQHGSHYISFASSTPHNQTKTKTPIYIKNTPKIKKISPAAGAWRVPKPHVPFTALFSRQTGPESALRRSWGRPWAGGVRFLIVIWDDFDSNLVDFDSNLVDFDRNLVDFDSNSDDFDSNFVDFDGNLVDFEVNLVDFEVNFDDFD